MLHTSFSYFDITVIGIMALSCLFAFWRGFVKEILSLGAWIGAGIITIYYFPGVAEDLQPHFKKPIVAAGIATLTLYITSLLLFSMVNALILRFVKQGSDVGFLDNSLGLFFGAFRGAFILSLGFFLLTMVLPKDEYPEWVAGAKTRPLVEQGAVLLAAAAPEYLRELSPLSADVPPTKHRLALFRKNEEKGMETDVSTAKKENDADGEQMKELIKRIDQMEGPAR